MTIPRSFESNESCWSAFLVSASQRPMPYWQRYQISIVQRCSTIGRLCRSCAKRTIFRYLAWANTTVESWEYAYSQAPLFPGRIRQTLQPGYYRLLRHNRSNWQEQNGGSRRRNAKAPAHHLRCSEVWEAIQRKATSATSLA